MLEHLTKQQQHHLLTINKNFHHTSYIISPTTYIQQSFHNYETWDHTLKPDQVLRYQKNKIPTPVTLFKLVRLLTFRVIPLVGCQSKLRMNFSAKLKNNRNNFIFYNKMQSSTISASIQCVVKGGTFKKIRKIQPCRKCEITINLSLDELISKL